MRRKAFVKVLFLLVAPCVAMSWGGQQPDVPTKPGDDFYLFANSEWMHRSANLESGAQSGVLASLQELDLIRKRHLFEQAARQHAPQRAEVRKMADLYRSYMDVQQMQAHGLQPLKPHLNAILLIRDKQNLARALGASLRLEADLRRTANVHVTNLFGLWVAPDSEHPQRFAAYLLQGGLGMPGEKYYLSDSEEMRQTRELYVAHAASVLSLAGLPDPATRARRIVDLEQAIASTHQGSQPDAERLSMAGSSWRRVDFDRYAPGMDWEEYFRGASLDKQQTFIVWQPGAIAGESALVENYSLQTWKDWMLLRLIESYAFVLPPTIDRESEAFAGRILTASGPLSRSDRAVAAVSDEMSGAVGRQYARLYFPPRLQAQAEALSADILQAFARQIERLDWMNAGAKAATQLRLRSLSLVIGYSRNESDYSGYRVDANDAFGNLWRGNLFRYRQALALLNRPVDRRSWIGTQQSVVPVNLPLQNSIFIPAALLQPPLFDSDAPAAANYGAAGSVIAHEVSHMLTGFESSSPQQSDWGPAELSHFHLVAGQLVRQYDEYKPLADLAVNGRRTLYENMADLAGLSVAYDACQHAASHPAGQTVEENDRAFFLAFARIWATKLSQAALRKQLETDFHAPAEYRADSVRNFDAWYTAFGVKAGDKLYLAPQDRVHIW